MVEESKLDLLHDWQSLGVKLTNKCDQVVFLENRKVSNKKKLFRSIRTFIGLKNKT